MTGPDLLPRNKKPLATGWVAKGLRAVAREVAREAVAERARGVQESAGTCSDARPGVRSVSTIRDGDPAFWNDAAFVPACADGAPADGATAVVERQRIWDDGAMAPPRPAVFRLPAIALIFPALLLFCVVPLASLGGWWLLMYLVPVVGLAWILLTRTTVGPDGLRVSTLRGRRSLAWDTIEHLELDGPRWLVAVQQNGRRTRLPMVLPRDLPRLSAASGGALDFRMPEADVQVEIDTTVPEATVDETGETARAGSGPGTDPDGTSDRPAVSPADPANGPPA